jgi:hypothetical protein
LKIYFTGSILSRLKVSPAQPKLNVAQPKLNAAQPKLNAAQPKTYGKHPSECRSCTITFVKDR